VSPAETRYFAMPGPYEKRARRDVLLAELKRFIADTHQ
jgi:hypothetical protein